MSRLRVRAPFHEPSLVPLADLLSNLVGIILFILIFVVLAAGSVVLPKRLPIERATDATPVFFVCANQRILPLDEGPLADPFLEPLGNPDGLYDSYSPWLVRFNEHQVEDKHFVVRGRGEVHKLPFGNYSQVSLEFAPKEGAGETTAELKLGKSNFGQILASHDPGKRFMYVFVRPDCVEAFQDARELAVAHGFRTGWKPLAAGDPIRFTLTGGGVTPVPQ